MIQQSHFEYTSKRTESKISKRYLHTHVHHSIIHCNQNVEATKISIDKQMDKKCGIYKQWNMMPPLKGKKPCNTMD